MTTCTGNRRFTCSSGIILRFYYVVCLTQGSFSPRLHSIYNIWAGLTDNAALLGNSPASRWLRNKIVALFPMRHLSTMQCSVFLWLRPGLAFALTCKNASCDVGVSRVFVPIWSLHHIYAICCIVLHGLFFMSVWGAVQENNVRGWWRC